MGWLIQRFRLQPFIVTLAGMFLARGLCYLISIDSISITDAAYTAIAQTRLPLRRRTRRSPSARCWRSAMVAHRHLARARAPSSAAPSMRSAATRRRRVLMGLPVARTTVLIYTFSGFCSALAGVVFTFYMLSGYGLHAVGLELDAIAAVVIGGTLLTGGVGYVVGTLFGVLILGIDPDADRVRRHR